MTTNQNINPYEKQGFDFDPEIIDLIDAVLQNITDSGELKEEFKKLKFVKQLEGTYNSRPGPLKQLIEKMGTIEREFTRTQLDMQRATNDMQHAVRSIYEAVNSKSREELYKSIEKLQGIESRAKYYSWNSKQDGN